MYRDVPRCKCFVVLLILRHELSIAAETRNLVTQLCLRDLLLVRDKIRRKESLPPPGNTFHNNRTHFSAWQPKVGQSAYSIHL